MDPSLVKFLVQNWSAALVAVLLVTGFGLVPQWVYKTVAAERDTWRASSEAKDATIASQQETIKSLTAQSELSVRLLEDLGHQPGNGRTRARRASPRGDPA
jgi:hypothetical protein